MLIIAVVVVLSCQNDKEGRVPEQNYPIKIEFTNFAWDGNHNLWTNLDYDGKVIIINSIEELQNYVNSLDDNDYADIDFSKYSLLLASGISDYGISDIKAKTFQQLAENHYELEIEITLNDVLECEQWLLAVIVDKLSADSKVDLKITTFEEVLSLLNTKWKLAGIVDTETGELKELEPKDCEECYTIAFDTDKTFSGRTASNIIDYADYEIDYKTGGFYITNIIGTERAEIGEGYLYCDILWKIKSFTITDKYPRILHLYYNDKKNYLLFKRQE